jgi:hypothetical protein
MRATVRALRTLAVTTMAFPLGACFADQKREIAACQREAFETFFANNSVEAPDELADPGETLLYIANCMMKRGYVEDASDGHCGSGLNSEVNPYCYAPAGKFAFVVHKIESVFEP